MYVNISVYFEIAPNYIRRTNGNLIGGLLQKVTVQDWGGRYDWLAGSRKDCRIVPPTEDQAARVFSITLIARLYSGNRDLFQDPREVILNWRIPYFSIIARTYVPIYLECYPLQLYLLTYSYVSGDIWNVGQVLNINEITTPGRHTLCCLLIDN